MTNWSCTSFTENENRITSAISDSKYDIADLVTSSHQGKANQGFSGLNEDAATISSVKISDNPYYGEESLATENVIMEKSSENLSKDAIVQISENPYYGKE